MTGGWVGAALTALILLCAGRLIWVDLRRFEIETPTLLLLGSALLAQSALSGTPLEVLIRLLAALAFYGAVILLTRNVRGLSRIGAGDPPLIGVIAFMVFPLLVPWALLSGLMILITAAAYSRIRRKRFLRSMFPAAPPLLAAAIPIYLIVLSA